MEPPVAGLEKAPGVGRGRQVAWLFGAVGLMILLVIGGLMAGGELAAFASAGLTTIPLILLGAALQLATIRRGARIVAWLGFWLILGGIGLLSLGLTLGALISTAPGAAPFANGEAVTGIAVVLLLCLIAALLAIVLALSGWWYRLSRTLGGHPDRTSSAHAMGVIGLVAFVILALAPLLALGGEAPLLRLLSSAEGISLARDESGAVRDLFYGLAWMLPLALIGAGFPVRRSFGTSLERLGIGSLPLRAIGLLVLVAVGLVIFAMAFEYAVGAVFELAGWPRTDPDALGKLFEGLDSLAGAIAVGVTAGIGEELIVRGLFQTRFGWLLPNLAFASAHGFQYGWDALLNVFVIGAVLAWVRHRWNTTGSVLVHATYNFVLVIGGVIGLPGF